VDQRVLSFKKKEKEKRREKREENPKTQAHTPCLGHPHPPLKFSVFSYQL
jgi:hypothetical protein